MFNDDFYNKTLKKYAKEIRQNDLIRQNELHILGYNVLVVWEYDWKHNKLLVLEQIKKFLNDV
jgi:G:T-mismatch repair DNA endonuclease (very short patch repair protein)